MRATPSAWSSAVIVATLAAAAVTAQFIGGKAARDALFLDQFDITVLPTMLVATSAFSILLIAMNAKLASRFLPTVLVPVAFVASAAVLLAGWMLSYTAPAAAAVLVYLHVSGFGPILGSGFWLVASERFDPRTAKRKFGQIAGGGTLGGLVGGLVAERVAVLFSVAAMLPLLAAVNLLCALLVSRLALVGRSPSEGEFAPELTPESAWSGVRVLADRPYLRHLALLVLLGTTSAALIDYVFKAQAVATLGTGENLLRFFAVYYAGVSLVTFAVQAALSRPALERYGLAFTSATPSIGLMVGGVGAWLAPGLESAVVARGAESALRGSLFRAGYEVFYTPMPAAEKRAAKSIIDVGFDRLGDAVGGGAVRGLMTVAPQAHGAGVIGLTVFCSALAVWFASRLNRGYVLALEDSLRNRAVELDLSDVTDSMTRTIVLRTLSSPPVDRGLASTARRSDTAAPLTATGRAIRGLDADVQDILALTSHDLDRTRAVLRREGTLAPALIPQVIPLLAWDAVADDAIRALRQVVNKHVGALSDALLDPAADFAVRRRVARVMGACASQRAVDGLLAGLGDIRFEVRVQCGRSLALIVAKQPDLHIDPQRVLAVVQQEASVSRPVWEGRRLLDKLEDREGGSVVDEFVRGRASQSLAHVFTLLSLVLPSEPLQIALRGLHTSDERLRGTALEYLESVLPPGIRDSLWPFLEDSAPKTRTVRPREEVLADLLRSNHSIRLNLEEIRRRRRE